MSEVAATFFDGRTPQARPVVLRFEPGGVLVIQGEGVDLRYGRAELRIESRLGNAPRFVRLPGDARCEVTDNDAMDRACAVWGRAGAAGWLHRLEASWPLAVTSALVMSLIALVGVVFGLPIAAKSIAYRLPMSVSERIGSDALAALDRILFDPSKLGLERQAELQGKFREFLRRQSDEYPYKLEFRASPKIGANAFALPNGTIVMTDELIELAEHDDEILGVLAHECGHVQGRHALRSVLQDSAFVVVLTLATGDMSTVSAVGAALPTLLMEAKFSRAFETEADAYGVNAMRQAGLDPVRLATMLERLTRGTGQAEEMLSYISSHPATSERVRAIKGDGSGARARDGEQHSPDGAVAPESSP